MHRREISFSNRLLLFVALVAIFDSGFCCFSSSKENNNDNNNQNIPNSFTSSTKSSTRSSNIFPNMTLPSININISTISSINIRDIAWNNFLRNNNKSYNRTESEFRRKIFDANFEMINQHNKDFLKGLTTYDIAMNQFGDWTDEEFMATSNFGKEPNLTNLNLTSSSQTFQRQSIPSAIDWRDLGYVTFVKDQGSICGSCWAFSAVVALEGQYKKVTGKLETFSFSEQNLVDCVYESNGCSGGFAHEAFDFIRRNKGINDGLKYPYSATSGKCMYDLSKNAMTKAQLISYSFTQQGNENELTAAIANIGPVSVSIDAKTLRFYSRGIFDGYSTNKSLKCSNDIQSLTHQVAAVGYGSENGKPYYIIKNSWGFLGENGYIRWARNKNNLCGVASLVSYPTLKPYLIQTFNGSFVASLPNRNFAIRYFTNENELILETWDSTNRSLVNKFSLDICITPSIEALPSGDIICQSKTENRWYIYNPISGTQVANFYPDNLLKNYLLNNNELPQESSGLILNGILSNDYLVGSLNSGIHYHIIDPYNGQIVKRCIPYYYSSNWCSKYLTDAYQPFEHSILPNGLFASYVGSEIIVFNILTEEIVVIISRIDLLHWSYMSKAYLMGFYADNSSKIWDLNTRSVIKTGRWNSKEMFSSFLPILSMNYTVIYTDGLIKIWNLETGLLQRIIQVDTYSYVNVISNNQLVASSYNKNDPKYSGHTYLLDPFLNF